MLTHEQMEWIRKDYPVFWKKYCIEKHNATEAQVRTFCSKEALKVDRSNPLFKERISIKNISRKWEKRQGHSEKMKSLHKEWKTFCFKHWLSNSTIYVKRRSMIARCENSKNASYAVYGWRGIKVCNEWKTFSSFVERANKNGYDDTLSIERKDVNGDYCPDNCTFIRMELQARNRRTNSVDQKMVARIRKAYASGLYTQRELAKNFWIDYRHVHLVVSRKIRN